MKKIILLLLCLAYFMLMFLMAPLATAQSADSISYCAGTALTTLYTVDSKTYNLSLNCSFGCNSGQNRCNPNPYSESNNAVSSVMAFGIFTSSVIFFVLAMKTTQWHGMLQILFMVAGFLMLIVSFSFARIILYNIGSTDTLITLLDEGVLVSSVIFWVFITYFMINFLVTNLNAMLGRKKKNEEGGM